MGTQTPSSRTINAKTGWIIIGIVLAVVIGIGAAVAPSSGRSIASTTGSQSTGEWQGEALNQRMGAAVQMLNDGKLNAEQFKQLRAKFKAGLDQSNGKQLTGYAYFLWAANDANHLPADLRIDLHEEGASVLNKAEALGYTQAYVIDGSWAGGIRAGGMSAFMGPDDPRTKYWPILSTIQKWATGATKGDPACRFMMDRIAPSWEQAQSVLLEHMRLETTYAAKPSHAPSDPDIARLDELKQQWILSSGMVPIHAQAHPQHGLPCWEWLNEKGGDLFVQWNQTQASAPPPVAPSIASTPAQQNLKVNGDASSGTPSSPGHGSESLQELGLPTDLVPMVPITSLVEILPRPELVYPTEARARKIQGVVQVEVTVSAAGFPINAVSLSGPVVLRDVAEQWQMKRRFQPPVFEGRNRPVKVTNTVSFTLDQPPASQAPVTKPTIASPIQTIAPPAQASGYQPPRVVTQAPAVFPQRARQMSWETNRDHTVTLKVFVSEQGMPLRISVVDGGSSGFTEAATEAARRSTFAPAMKNGQPIKAWLEMKVVIPKISQ